MAVICKLPTAKFLKHTTALSKIQVCLLSSQYKKPVFNRKKIYTTVGIVAGGLGALMYLLDKSVSAYEWPLEAPAQKWSHNGVINSFDHASIRRGYEVYKNVCSACHGLMFVPFRRLVNVAFTESEMKKHAADVMITDGPDDNGDYYQRPGKLSDYMPSPYANDKQAKAANNGALPPDLSVITYGREGGEDYVFALLTGYQDPPAGVKLEEGSYYNPYMHGSLLAMAPPLYNNVIEYSDGTPATKSQLAKDVVTFLTWCAQPELDKRKSWFIKINAVMWPIIAILFYYTRFKYTSIRARKLVFPK